MNPSCLKRSCGLVLALLACAPARAEHREARAPIIVPVEIRDGLIIVHARVNEHDVLLVLDTGSGVSVLDPMFAQEAAIDLSGTSARVKGTAGATVQLGSARSIQIGDAILRRVPVASVSLDALQASLGSDVRGTIGYDLFDQFVVSVDYDAHTITLAEPDSYTYRGTGVALPLVIRNHVPALSASLLTRKHGAVPTRLHFDLGASGYALRLASPFVRANDLVHDTTALAGLFGTGVGGVIKGELMRLPALTLGTLTVARPSTALFTESDGAFGNEAEADGAIGSPVWSRMHLIIDYARSRLIVEPRGRLDIADSVSSTGISLVQDPTSPRAMRVSYVVDGSAGAIAGVREGDELLGIDGRAATGLTIARASSALRHATAPTTLTVRREGSDLTLHITPRQTF